MNPSKLEPGSLDLGDSGSASVGIPRQLYAKGMRIITFCLLR